MDVNYNSVKLTPTCLPLPKKGKKVSRAYHYTIKKNKQACYSNIITNKAPSTLCSALACVIELDHYPITM